MKKIITLLLAFACMAGMVHAGQKYVLNVGEFNELSVVDPLNVDYVCSADSAGMVAFTCDPSVASSLMFNLKGSKLNVRIASEEAMATKFPRITVYSRYLTKVENKGDSTVRVIKVAETPKFEAVVEGNGTLVVRHIDAVDIKAGMRLGHGMVVISGACSQLNVAFTGTGVIQADDLKATEVSVKANGTGSVGVWAEKFLKVYGMGSTTLYYKGHPEIKTRSLGIKLIPLAQ